MRTKVKKFRIFNSDTGWFICYGSIDILGLLDRAVWLDRLRWNWFDFLLRELLVTYVFQLNP